MILFLYSPTKLRDLQGEPATKIVHLDVMKRIVLLLECILVYPALYDKENPHYKDDEYHIKIWHEIHKVFNRQCKC